MEFTKEEFERFCSKIDIRSKEECWNWKADRFRAGYGMFTLRRPGRKTWAAHRIAWIMWNMQAIPRGMVISHTCSNKACVNPRHLELATYSENNQHTVLSGRANHRVGESCSWSKLTDEAVREIRTSSASGVSLAAKFGVSPSQVSHVKSGRRWTHL